MSWRHQYILQLIATDVIGSTFALAAGWLFGMDGLAGHQWPEVLLVSAAVLCSWIVALQLGGAYETRHVSIGAEEYKRVLRANAIFTGMASLICFTATLDAARGLVIVVIPIGFFAQCVARCIGRIGVHARRRRGLWCSQILVVGTHDSVRDLVDTARRSPQAGLIVVGACVDDPLTGADFGNGGSRSLGFGVPIVGSIAQAAQAAAELDVDVVAVAGGVPARGIRELGWQLEGSGRDLLMAPALTEVAGPRVHVSPVDGVPLMWVDQPQFTGLRLVVKRLLDVIGSLVVLVLTSPVFAAAALLVRLSSRGPALYKHVRLGRHGDEFVVYKFRSMHVGADKRRTELLGYNESDGGMLFKMRRDPRVTPIGRVLRKYSLDELPQLFNVLRGSMSLVGPRPPLPEEVERYHTDVRRRLLVKPGLTGLWQVSGRSDLSWDEAVRLDLYYVENWSLPLDLAIIARTVWAVLRSRGAY